MIAISLCYDIANMIACDMSASNKNNNDTTLLEWVGSTISSAINSTTQKSRLTVKNAIHCRRRYSYGSI